MKIIKNLALCASVAAIAALSATSVYTSASTATAETETISTISTESSESTEDTIETETAETFETEETDEITETEVPVETDIPTETTVPVTEEPTEPKPVEESVIELINNYRVANGCSELSGSASLNEITQIRSKEINSLLSHYRPNSKLFSSIFAEYGIDVKYIGEAIATGNDELDTPEKVVAKWIKSEEDNGTILGKNYQYAGLHLIDSSNSSYKHNWVLILAGNSSYLNAEKNQTLKGDINGDGEVNSLDAVITLKNYAASLTDSQKKYTESYLKFADVDGDKKITSKDAVKILINYADRLAGNSKPL